MRAIFASLMLAVVLPLCGAAQVQAQEAVAPATDPMAARLSAEKVAGIEAGEYGATDRTFSLHAYGDKFLLRFPPAPENYVLTVERVALGGRILRYDSGAIALRISVWGGMTLYTEDMPGGAPATRIGDPISPARQSVSPADLTAAIADAAAHLAYSQQVRLRFSADPAILTANEDIRELAFDTVVNTNAGIERLLAAPGNRQGLIRKFDSVRIVTGDRPGVTQSGRTIVVSFMPGAGPAGRASSREIALLLAKLL